MVFSVSCSSTAARRSDKIGAGRSIGVIGLDVNDDDAGDADDGSCRVRLFRGVRMALGD
jgi:hypothetical protein